MQQGHPATLPHLFDPAPRHFSFNLRARTYARDYNQTLISHLLKQSKRGRDRNR